MSALYREAEVTAWRLLGLTNSRPRTMRRDSAKSAKQGGGFSAWGPALRLGRKRRRRRPIQ